MIAITVINKDDFFRIMRNFGIFILYLAFVSFFLTASNFIYRSRLIFALTFLVMGFMLLMSTCLIINNKRLEKLEQKRIERKMIKYEKRKEEIRLQLL